MEKHLCLISNTRNAAVWQDLDFLELCILRHTNTPTHINTQRQTLDRHTHTHTYIHTHIHTHTYTHTYTHIHTHIVLGTIGTLGSSHFPTPSYMNSGGHPEMGL